MKTLPDGSVRPHLAESVTRPNPVTYIYRLRKGIRFWNGNELTAADVANALNYYRYPQLRQAYAYTSVRRIRATGRYTVVVTLKRPDAGWQSVLSGWAGGIFEKKFGDAHPGTMGRPGVLTMGTGPWKIDSLDPTRGVELSANDRYWGKRPHIRRISIKFFPNETSAALAFRAGEVDIQFPISNARAFAATSGATITSVPSCFSGYVAMNTKVAPWNDVRVRRAVAYAINRGDAIRAYGGPARPAATFIPRSHLRALASESQVRALFRSLPRYPFDLERARQEMARSAHPQGFKATISGTSFDNITTVAQALAGNLRRIGIDLEVRELPFGQLISQIFGQHDFGITMLTAGCTPDPGFYPNNFVVSRQARKGGLNIAEYTKPAVDSLVRAGNRATTPAERFAVYGRLLRIMGQDVPYMPLFNQSVNMAISPRLTWPAFHQYSNFTSPAWALDVRPR